MGRGDSVVSTSRSGWWFTSTGRESFAETEEHAEAPRGHYNAPCRASHNAHSHKFLAPARLVALFPNLVGWQ